MSAIAAGTVIAAGAVIAAGSGSRLRDLGVPKPLVKIAGVPLIEHVLANFEAAGIARAAVIFNESERDCEAFVRERFGKLVETVLVKTTKSSLESFREILAVAPKGRLLVSTVDAFCPPQDFERFVRRAEELPANATVLAVTRYVHDEKPLWVTTTRKGRVSVVGGASGDAVTAGIYVFPEKVRRLGIPSGLGRLRDFLGWLASSGQPIEAIEIQKVVDVDRAEDIAAAEELATSSLSRREPTTDPTTRGKPPAEGNAARTRRRRKPPAVGESSTTGKPTAVDNTRRRPVLTHTGRRPVLSGGVRGPSR